MLNHDDVTWDCPKSEKKGNLRHIILGRGRGVVGTCSRKPLILFWYTIDFNCCFDIFQQYIRFCCNFDSWF
jgi:hypothetical protein